MRDLTTEELNQWYADMKALCESLKGKTDSISNAIRITACETMSQIITERIRRNSL